MILGRRFALELWLPYGHTEIPVRVPDDNFFRILEPRRPLGTKEVTTLVEDALENPVGGLKLKDMVKPGTQAGIIVDPLLPTEAWRDAVKTLTTRLSTLGVENTKVFLRKRMISVDAADGSPRPLDPSQNSFTEIGKTAMGTAVDLDPEILSCEVRIMLSLAMPHFATGFTGGPEVVIPSCSSIRSIAKNRSLLSRGFPEALNTSNNAALSDSLEACKFAAPLYSISFLPDGWGNIGEAFAGDLKGVFTKAVERYAELHSPRVERKLDIVVVSAGIHFGTDLYHAVRVVANVIGAVRKEGTVILVAECSGGIGDQTFLDYARRFRERKELSAELRYRFKLGGHVNLFLKEILERCRIQLVSVLPEMFVRDTFDLKPSQTASEAIQKAIRLEGKESKILIVPRGDLTVPVMESS
jgi:lactate racemase